MFNFTLRTDNLGFNLLYCSFLKVEWILGKQSLESPNEAQPKPNDNSSFMNMGQKLVKLLSKLPGY